MRGRQVCWSDPKVQKLAESFIPATDEVWRLHNRDELDCRFFKGFCEEGHYGERSQPSTTRRSTTRQGIYCCTPSGKFLASINTTSPDRMADMLRDALEAWKKTPKSERLLDYDPAERAGEIERRERLYPEDGLGLRVYSRDMPRKGGRSNEANDWRRSAWNVDSLWYRKAEAATVLPEELRAGGSVTWPDATLRRLVRHNLVDNVRGQTNGYRDAQVQIARMTTTVTRRDGDVAHLTFAGESRATTSGTWPKGGAYAGMASHGPHTRGVATTMYGEAEYDVAKARFVRFEIAAAGTRFGQTRFNFRQDDLDETPIGFVIVLDEDDPGRRVAPAEMNAYGW